ncbi:MAG TPA: penicillin acylase family protein [Jatrophihabitantaceae bacterium]|nr:penicillin acylase family protein [Jatrophihabitantaceae bacterium]
MTRSVRMSRRAIATAAVAGVATLVAGLVPALAPSATSATPTGYRLNDYADGQAMSVLPPGQNGLVNAVDALNFETLGTRPKNSQDQLNQYANLLYGYPTLTNNTLSTYFNDESFGVKPTDITKTEKPKAGTTIYRDKLGIPHIYGDTDAGAAFGAGYAQAEDRLFMMDVLRHYGEGNLAEFLGGSCEFEQMDHDQLLLSAYTPERAQAQVDALPTLYGSQGKLARTMIYAYVDGVNAYVNSTVLNPQLLPADYAAAAPLLVPGQWKVGDVVAIAGLIGGIFGRGGGNEIANAALLKYLQQQMGTVDGRAAFLQFKSQNDPLAPTTSDQNFPYMIPGTIDPSRTALPDDPSAPLHGGPVNTDPNCNLQKPNLTALSILAALENMPSHMSNALVVNGDHTASGHPVAVFGPQVSYFAPQILSLLDLHSPSYDATGASFPGTGIVELGRGRDYAWSATSAGSDLIDQRLEKVCNPTGGAPDPEGKYYLFNGTCRAMVHETFLETPLPKPGGVGAPTQLKHEIYRTRHGIVQGWTTSGGQPVAVVNQRSTYEHDVDSVIGFLQWGEPSLTKDVKSWMDGAAKIFYTFNWFYVDDRDTGYFVSGLDPVRSSHVDPNLPTWGTGVAEWQSYLPASQHVQQINPPQGFFVSWNNKPAPQFSAADDQYGYGQNFRSQMLVNQLQVQFASTGNKVTRADVVQAMERAASQDLDGLTMIPLLLQYLQGHSEPAGVQAMLDALTTWVQSGAHRKKAAPGDTQYDQAAAVAISDELVPNLIRSLYDGILAAGGVGTVGNTGGATDGGYSKLPMQFVNTPNSGGAHLGSSYDGGYEGYVSTTLQQLMGQNPADAFGPQITSRICGGGPATCGASIDAALLKTYNTLVGVNGSSNVASWTSSSANKATGETMPQFDSIQFRALGIVGQPAIDWQNRPTFQQVVEFPRHRSRGLLG